MFVASPYLMIAPAQICTQANKLLISPMLHNRLGLLCHEASKQLTDTLVML